MILYRSKKDGGQMNGNAGDEKEMYVGEVGGEKESNSRAQAQNEMDAYCGVLSVVVSVSRAQRL